MHKLIWDATMADWIKETREKAGRKAEPSYGKIDSQSVKTFSASEQNKVVIIYPELKIKR